jgi:hypothetical protein
MNMVSDAPRYVNLLGATGQIRAATFQERSHLVVPVVALVEGVLHPANTDAPEFVPAEVIGSAPIGWNGRPVVVGHPQVGLEFVSANSPDILEKESIGLLFNSSFENGKLLLEAWIDKEKASKEGTEASKLISKIEAGEMIEVSVGALVSTQRKMGVYKGKQFFREWKSLVPDHLAFLKDGDTGACSNAGGCGAPRVACSHLITAEGYQVVGDPPMANETEQEQPKRTLRERLLDIMKFRNNMSEEDMSDRDLREALSRSLSNEPGFIGIDSVFPADSKVIYAVATGEKILLFSRDYTFAKGEVKLASKKEEVQPVTRFEPVNAQSAGCGCANRGGAMDKAQRVNALISGGRFLETDRTWLEQIPEDRLGALEAAPPAAPQNTENSAASTITTSNPAATATVSSTVALTAEQYIAQAPPELQESLREGLRVQQERRNQVLAALKATGRCDFSDAELTNMGTASLERLLKLADVVPPPSFVGRVNTRDRSKPEGVPAPPDLGTAIRAARGIK